mmetsp:Transcript_12573/g.31730  ORF Transcript_12573/g.31730 Transcript_12573/m.31730 type:complete len:466 (-) Transcript_12573:51-1448(-)
MARDLAESMKAVEVATEAFNAEAAMSEAFNAEMEGKLERYAAHTERLNETVASLEAQLAEAVDEAGAKQAAMEAKVAELEERRAKAEAAAAEVAEAASAEKASLQAALEAKTASAEADLERAAARVQELQDAIAAIRVEMGAAVVAAQAATQQVQTELEDAVVELDAERQAREALEGECKALKLAAPPQEDVVAAKAEGSLKAQVAYMEAQLKATQVEMDAIVAKCETLVMSNNALKRGTEKLNTRLLFEKRKMEKVKKAVSKAPVPEDDKHGKENHGADVKPNPRRTVESAGLPSTGGGQEATPMARNRKKSCSIPTPAAMKQAPQGLPPPGSTPAKTTASRAGPGSTPARPRSMLGEVQNLRARPRHPAKGTPVPKEAFRGHQPVADGSSDDDTAAAGDVTDTGCVTPVTGKGAAAESAENATPSTLSRVYSGVAGAVGGVVGYVTTPRQLYRSLSGARGDQP